jgi:hypothetical protein
VEGGGLALLRHQHRHLENLDIILRRVHLHHIPSGCSVWEWCEAGRCGAVARDAVQCAMRYVLDNDGVGWCEVLSTLLNHVIDMEGLMLLGVTRVL